MKIRDIIDKLIVAVFILVVVALVGALIMAITQAYFAPDEGYVISKIYTEASYSTVGAPHYKPEQYQLVIEGINRDGDITQGIIYVDAHLFHETKLKDFFSKTCMCVLKR